MKYRIIFGVEVALSEEVGLSNTYTCPDRAWRAAYACMKQHPGIITTFRIVPATPMGPMAKRLALIKEIMPLYPLAYPKVTKVPLWSGELFSALYGCPMSYLEILLDTLEVTVA